MTIFIMEEKLLVSDCTIIAHQMNCFGVKEGHIAKQMGRQYPEVMEAERRFKLPPRQKLGRFSFAPSKDGTRLVFHLYGQFRYGSNKHHTDQQALNQALDMFFKAVRMAEKKGFPIKIGMPYDIVSDEKENTHLATLQLLEDLSTSFNYDIYLYKN